MYVCVFVCFVPVSAADVHVSFPPPAPAPSPYPLPFAAAAGDFNDEFVIQTLFRNEDGSYKRGGVFVDVGAYDGYHSNTYNLEVVLGWTGVCLEPQPHMFNILTQFRTCVALPVAAYNRTGTVDFTVAVSARDDPGDFIQMMGGITEAYDPRHVALIQGSAGRLDQITVPTVRLADVLAQHGIPRVDLLKIDVENSEAQVLEGVDFDAVFVDVVQVEEIWSSNTGPVYDLMAAHGFDLIGKHGKDLIFRNRKQLTHIT